jgi:hypothetical protein
MIGARPSPGDPAVLDIAPPEWRVDCRHVVLHLRATRHLKLELRRRDEVVAVEELQPCTIGGAEADVACHAWAPVGAKLNDFPVVPQVRGEFLPHHRHGVVL